MRYALTLAFSLLTFTSAVGQVAGKVYRGGDIVTINDIAGLQAELRKWAETETAKKFKIIIGFGYDDAKLKEQRHPTRHDLDEVSKDVPKSPCVNRPTWVP